jgi:hypothetical protein
VIAERESEVYVVSADDRHPSVSRTTMLLLDNGSRVFIISYFIVGLLYFCVLLLRLTFLHSLNLRRKATFVCDATSCLGQAGCCARDRSVFVVSPKWLSNLLKADSSVLDWGMSATGRHFESATPQT